MTKEPIMIDDVNVKDCKHFNYGEGYNSETEEFIEGACECITAHNEYGEFEYFGVCKGRDCYYKQLKRKEEECEELKKYRPIIDRLLKQFETYDKLKSLDVVTFAKQTFEQLDQLKARSEETIDGLLSVQYQLADNCRKYEQALQDIKEIAEKVLKKCNNCDQFSCFSCPDENKDELAQQILQKCEVIDEK